MLDLKQLDKQTKLEATLSFSALLFFIGLIYLYLHPFAMLVFVATIIVLVMNSFRKIKQANKNLTAKEISWLEQLDKISSQNDYNIKYLLSIQRSQTTSPSLFFAWNRSVFIHPEAVNLVSPGAFYKIFLETPPGKTGGYWMIRTILLNMPLTLSFLLSTVAFSPLTPQFSIALTLVMLVFIIVKLTIGELIGSSRDRTPWLIHFLSYKGFAARKYLIKYFRRKFPHSNLKTTMRKFARFGPVASLVPNHQGLQIALVVLALASFVYRFSFHPEQTRQPAKAAAEKQLSIEK